MDLAQLCRENRLARDYLAAVEYHEELASTSDRALELAALPETPRPLLVVAKRQTAGRGRGSNVWWSAGGSLIFSLLTGTAEGTLPPERQPLVSLAVGLALAGALSQVAPQARVGVKWPNDVWINGRKVAGILIEAPAGNPPPLVIGVGLNVNNSFAEAPPELQAEATSLADATGHPHEMHTVLATVLEHMQRELTALAENRLSLAERWPASCVLTGQQIRVSTGQSVREGLCLGIEDSGALLVEDGQKIERCFAGTVRVIQQG